MGRISGWIDSAWIEIIRGEFELRVCRRGLRIGEILCRIKEGETNAVYQGGAKVLPAEGSRSRPVVEIKFIQLKE